MALPLSSPSQSTAQAQAAPLAKRQPSAHQRHRVAADAVLMVEPLAALLPSISIATLPLRAEAQLRARGQRPFGSPSSSAASSPIRSPSRAAASAGEHGVDPADVPTGCSSFRSIKDHQPPLGAGDRGVEPAGAVLGGAAEPVVVDDHVRPLRPLRLVAGDGVAPDRLDQALPDPVVAPVPLGIAARRARRSGPCR